MKIIDYTYDIENAQFANDTFKELYEIDYDKILYFDIETTGLSSRNSTLYLIGVLSYEKDKLHLRQWFNNDGYSEKELITSFDDYCSYYSCLIHFNGITFDIPYIRDKAARHNITLNNINDMKQVDIFKEIRSYKKLFGLDNMKQTTIEDYIGIKREDTYTGGELINVYQRYVARPDKEREHLLLLHNHDDVIGLTKLLPILNYKLLFEEADIISHKLSYDDNNLTMEITLNEHLLLPKRITGTNKQGIYINASDNSLIIIIPLINDNLKHFFKDYKNYYFLPKENMAVHKSVAAYVDSDNREPATKTSCYVTKTDLYIICPDKEYKDCFSKEYGDMITYRTLSSLINDTTKNQVLYITNILKSYKKNI